MVDIKREIERIKSIGAQIWELQLARYCIFLFAGVLIGCCGLGSIALFIPTGDSDAPPSETRAPKNTFTPSPSFTPSRSPTATIYLSPTASFTPSITATFTETLTPSITPTASVTLPAASGISCIPGNKREVGYVTSVTDGDTINVRIEGEIKPVRYIGIDAPEGSAYFAFYSTSRNVELVAGKWVTLIKDESEIDPFDRLLRYVVVGDVFVNYTLVREGFATAKNYPPDTACSSTFSAAQSSARSGDAGMWAPTATPRPTTPPTYAPQPTSPPDEDCHPSYPDVCIPPPPPDLDCKDIPYRRFRVLPPDPHNFDGDNDGIGCESG